MKSTAPESISEESYERIHLAPPEQRPTAIFNANRARVRHALSKLAYEPIVQMYPRRVGS
ncbi:hypothetical protein [Pandoraea anhela]|uniref:hypothetical protein n=1 Tax=Pandoraea anhela TaxID=2508295 RepID=UPI001242EACA|nr:hypothetical protein [Pandoraea anhela]